MSVHEALFFQLARSLCSRMFQSFSHFQTTTDFYTIISHIYNEFAKKVIKNYKNIMKLYSPYQLKQATQRLCSHRPFLCLHAVHKLRIPISHNIKSTCLIQCKSHFYCQNRRNSRSWSPVSCEVGPPRIWLCPAHSTNTWSDWDLGNLEVKLTLLTLCSVIIWGTLQCLHGDREHYPAIVEFCCHNEVYLVCNNVLVGGTCHPQMPAPNVSKHTYTAKKKHHHTGYASWPPPRGSWELTLRIIERE